jgi:hypothetical protein
MEPAPADRGELEVAGLVNEAPTRDAAEGVEATSPTEVASAEFLEHARRRLRGPERLVSPALGIPVAIKNARVSGPYGELSERTRRG